MCLVRLVGNNLEEVCSVVIKSVLLILILLFAQPAFTAELTKPECIAPAKPGGGHDIMCRFMASSLASSLMLEMSIRYQPGGIGALAYNHAVTNLRGSGGSIIAASTGTALNLALGKFGKYQGEEVTWLGAVGTDYGIIAVRSDSPWQNLGELTGALAKDNNVALVGGSGSIGSQDWMKMALTLEHVGVAPKDVRYISFEGGGDACRALLKGHIQVFPGEMTEVADAMSQGKVRVLAVFADQRLPGSYKSIPTAKELGYDVVWPVWRGYYLPPGSSTADYQWWVNTLYRLEVSGVLGRERERIHLYPLLLIGEEFDQYVRFNISQFRDMGRRFGLIK